MEVHLFLGQESPFHLLLLLIRSGSLVWLFFSLLGNRLKMPFFSGFCLYELLLIGFGIFYAPIFYLFLLAEPFFLSWFFYRNTYESFSFSAYSVGILYLGFDLLRAFFLFGLYAIVDHRVFVDFHVLLYGVVAGLSTYTLCLCFHYVHRYLVLLDEPRFHKQVRTSFFCFILIHLLLTLSQMCICSFLSLGCFSFLRTASLYGFAFVILRLRLSILSFEKEEREARLPMAKLCKKLGCLYQDLRGFRHDFAGMLVSFTMAIESRDWELIEKLHREVLLEANKSLSSHEYSYFDLCLLEDKTIRSLIFHYLGQAQETGLEFSLEIREKVPALNVNQLALVRLLTILLTNAVEAAQASEDKEIALAVFPTEQGLELILENSRPAGDLKVQKIYQSDWSTKGPGRGTGLFTVKRILNHETTMLLDTEFDEQRFTQHLTIRSHP
ncbi:GHKL domain-containing protein [Streptococcus danieliae]|uniref:GHKL domain-containing protein n=1 Tax=Streptococcus danieliae TaxID=747656 RepID=UPI003CEC3A0F